MSQLSGVSTAAHLKSDVPKDRLTRNANTGSDNTSITVTLAIYFLLSTPEYYHRLRKELDGAFPDPTSPLSLKTLTELEFLDAVINETLRLASPYFNPRITPRGGSVIDGNYIPGGTIVALAAHSQQVSPDNFYPSPQVRTSRFRGSSRTCPNTRCEYVGIPSG